MSKITGGILRTVILTECERSMRARHSLVSKTILHSVYSQLNLYDADDQQALLTYFGDMFRVGYFAWGMDINNPDPPWFHFTDKGRRALQYLSRDPMNPDGYLAYLLKNAALNATALSYIKEALLCYNNDCIKAAAVMIGATAESMLLELRDILIAEMEKQDESIPRALRDWRKAFCDEMTRILMQKCQDKKLTGDLREHFEMHWSSLIGQIRLSRNDAGHPSNPAPVTEEQVHASLLIFPELAFLCEDLSQWIQNSYS